MTSSLNQEVTELPPLPNPHRKVIEILLADEKDIRKGNFPESLKNEYGTLRGICFTVSMYSKYTTEATDVAQFNKVLAHYLVHIAKSKTVDVDYPFGNGTKNQRRIMYMQQKNGFRGVSKASKQRWKFIHWIKDSYGL